MDTQASPLKKKPGRPRRYGTKSFLMVGFRVTEDEHEVIHTQAAKEGISASEYCRRIILPGAKL